MKSKQNIKKQKINCNESKTLSPHLNQTLLMQTHQRDSSQQ